MRRRIVLSLCAVTLLSLAFRPDRAASQQSSIRDQIIGAWTLVAAVNERADGSKVDQFGPNPKGIIIFAREGYFSLFQSQAEVPKLAGSDRAKVTPDEAMAVVRAAIAYYGTYSVNEAEKILSVRIEGSTFANLAGGGEQKRIITSLTANELKFTNPRTPNGSTLHTVWKRAQSP
jgi:hypothetical protein